MPMLFAVVATTLLTVLAPSAASAQEKTFGVAMGFPASVGVFWKVSDRVAVRPEFTFSKSEDDDTTFWAVGTGVSGLIYLNSMNPLRTYVAPRFTYTRQFNRDTTFFNFESTTNVYSLSGLFGAQYLIGERFLVFGEVGARWGYSSGETEVTDPFINFFPQPTSGYTLGTTGGVGIVLLF